MHTTRFRAAELVQRPRRLGRRDRHLRWLDHPLLQMDNGFTLAIGAAE
jgi:hypothetical protein